MNVAGKVAGILGSLAIGCGQPAPVAAPVVASELTAGTHTASVDGVALSYDVRGSGPMCIAFPGGPGMSAGYLKSEALERSFTIVYVDPLGTGASGKLPTYSMTRDVASLEKLRLALHVDKLCILGHSYGGFVALRYAVEHPANVRALILYSTAAATDAEWQASVGVNMTWFKDEPWFPDAMKGFELDAKATSQAEIDQVFQLIAPLYFVHWTRDKERFAPMLASTSMSYEVYKKRDEETFDVRAQLKGITVPTLIIAADRDFILGVGPGTKLAALIKGAVMVEIKDSGHFAHLEQPEAFERAIASFAATLR